MEPKPKSLLLQERSEKVKEELSFKCSDSELGDQLEQLESNVVETQVKPVY